MLADRWILIFAQELLFRKIVVLRIEIVTSI